MARFVGYSPHENEDTINAHFDDGSTTPFAVGADNRDELVAQAPLPVAPPPAEPDMRLAENDAGAGGAGGGGNAGGEQPGPERSIADVGAPMAPVQPAATPENTAPPPAAAQPAPAPVPPSPAPIAPAPPQPPPQAAPTGWVPGMPVDMPGPRTAATPAHWTPKGQTTETEHEGAAFTQKDVDQLVESSKAQGEAAKNYAKAVGNRADEEALRIQRIKDDQWAARQEFLTNREAAQRDIDKAAKGESDPNHWFHSQSTFGQIVTTFGQLVSAFTSAYTNRPTLPAEMMQKTMDRDIRSQEDALNRKGAAANNRLSQLMTEYKMDREDAIDTLRQEQEQLMSAVGKQFAGATNSKEVMAAWQQQDAQRQANVQAQVRAMADRNAGKVKTTGTEAFTPAQSGGGGGPSLDLMGKRLALEKSAAEVAKLRGEAAGGGKETQAEAQKFGQEMAPHVASRAAYEPVKKLLDKAQASGEDIPGFGSPKLQGVPVVGRAVQGEEGRENRRIVRDAIAARLRTITPRAAGGAMMSDEAAQGAADAALGQFPDTKSVANWFKRTDAQAAASETNVAKSFSPEARQLYHGRKGERAEGGSRPMPSSVKPREE
jgi:hypothetical protein